MDLSPSKPMYPCPVFSNDDRKRASPPSSGRPGQSPTWYPPTGKSSTDFYPTECEPGGIQRLGKLVEDCRLDGLLLDGYVGGKSLGRTFGIRDRRDLVNEVKKLSQKWGIGE